MFEKSKILSLIFTIYCVFALTNIQAVNAYCDAYGNCETYIDWATTLYIVLGVVLIIKAIVIVTIVICRRRRQRQIIIIRSGANVRAANNFIQNNKQFQPNTYGDSPPPYPYFQQQPPQQQQPQQMPPQQVPNISANIV